MSEKENTVHADLALDAGSVILLVEDDPVCRAMLREMFADDDVVLLEAGTLKEAWNFLDKNNAVKVDAVLLDRLLPDGDGLDLLNRLRSRPGLGAVPVIVQSCQAEAEDLAAGFRQGAYHYLAKPLQRDMVRAVVRLAIRHGRERKALLDRLHDAEDGLAFLTGMSFEIRTVGDAEVLSAYLARFFPNPESAALGLAALLNNAVEHGNLEIGDAKKRELLAANALNDEVRKRLASPTYWRRRVRVKFDQLDDRVEVLIADDGKGFDWKHYAEESAERLYDLHGRGIAVARDFCFDGIEYLGAGNQVRCWSLTED